MTSAGAQAIGGDSGDGALSADGRHVVYDSTATNLITTDTNNLSDVYRYDRNTGMTLRLSLTNGGLQSAGGGSFKPSVNANGQIVAFESTASNLVTGDSNASYDVFGRDLTAGTTTRVSVGPGGAQANDGSFDPSISADGRFVVFSSRANNSVPNGAPGVYLHDRLTRSDLRPHRDHGSHGGRGLRRDQR